LGIGFTFTI